MLILSPRVTHLLRFRHFKIYILKYSKPSLFPSFNVCIKVQFKKNLFNRFKSKFHNVDFGPMTHFPQKMESGSFMCLLNPKFKQKSNRTGAP